MDWINIGYILAVVCLVASMLFGYWGSDINTHKKGFWGNHPSTQQEELQITHGPNIFIRSITKPKIKIFDEKSLILNSLIIFENSGKNEGANFSASSTIRTSNTNKKSSDLIIEKTIYSSQTIGAPISFGINLSPSKIQQLKIASDKGLPIYFKEGLLGDDVVLEVKWKYSSLESNIIERTGKYKYDYIANEWIIPR